MALTPGLILAALLFAPPGRTTPPRRLSAGPAAASISAKPPAPKPAPSPKLSPNVVARVGGKDITREELMDGLAHVGVRETVLQWLHQKVVIEKEAKRLGVTVSAAELRKRVEEEKVKVVQSAIRTVGEPMTFDQVRTRFGVSVAEMEWRLRLNLLANKTFDKHLETQAPSLKGQRRLAHILIATIPLNGGAPAMTPEEAKVREEEALKKIEGIQADIKAKKITFEKAAAQFSDDKGPDGRGSASQGGGMAFSGKGVFDPDFEKAAWSLAKPGDMTPPVKTRFGWHLIKLLRKGEDATPAEIAAYRKDYVALAKADPRQLPQWLNSLLQKESLLFNTEFQLLEKKPVPTTKPAVKKPG